MIAVAEHIATSLTWRLRLKRTYLLRFFVNAPWPAEMYVGVATVSVIGRVGTCQGFVTTIADSASACGRAGMAALAALGVTVFRWERRTRGKIRWLEVRGPNAA